MAMARISGERRTRSPKAATRNSRSVKVGKSDFERTSAGTRGNDEDVPKAVQTRPAGAAQVDLSRSDSAHRKFPKADTRSFRRLLRSDTRAGPTRRCPSDGYDVSRTRVSQCN